MASINTVLLLGNLTRDPDLRYASNGTAVARLALAVNHRYRQGDTVREETMFIDVVAFGKQGENASKYLAKGNPVLVEGRLKWQSWEDKDKRKHTKHEVVAERIQFLGGARPERSAGSGERDAPDDLDGDIPF